MKGEGITRKENKEKRKHDEKMHCFRGGRKGESVQTNRKKDERLSGKDGRKGRGGEEE